jgi:FKBP-type peptidyl-prolyl cis-trans isomerase
VAKLSVQQIGILVITGVMVIGTLGSFAVMILSDKNQRIEQARLQELSDTYDAATKERQKKVDAQNAELSKRYFATFSKFKNIPAKFAIDSVTKLTTKDLLVGSGKKIEKNSALSVYYILWNPDGKVLETSIGDGVLNTPLAIEKLGEAALIDGWKEGLVGMKIGGVRLIEIPSDKAYGEAGSGDNIGPNTPIKFIVMAIDKVEEIPYPEVPKELLGSY